MCNKTILKIIGVQSRRPADAMEGLGSNMNYPESHKGVITSQQLNETRTAQTARTTQPCTLLKAYNCAGFDDAALNCSS
jgi:hypothetical protein